MPTTMPADPQTILDQVSRMHTFYADNWYHMLVFMGIALAIIGVLIPFLLQRMQYRLFKTLAANTESRINTNINTLIANTITQLKTQITEEIKKEQASSLGELTEKFEQEIKRLERDLNMTIAGVFQVQANTPDNRPRLYHAMSWARSAQYYLKAGDAEDRVQIALENTILLLEQSTKEEYENMPKHINPSPIDELLEDLEKANTRKQYTRVIRNIKTKYDAVKSTV